MYGYGVAFLAGAAEQHPPHVATARPDVGTRAALAELERARGDTELGIDLQSARLNPERARLLRGARVVVDQQHAHAATHQLVRQHQPGRACADDQDVGVHLNRPGCRRGVPGGAR